jgi:hypothetical protein
MELSGYVHASAALPIGKNPLYLLSRMLDGPQSRSGRFVIEKKIIFPIGFRIPDRPTRSLVAIPSTLSQLFS